MGSGITFQAQLAGPHEVDELAAGDGDESGIPLLGGVAHDAIRDVEHRLHEVLLDGFQLAGVAQLLEGVVVEQLEQPVSRGRTNRLDADERPLDQRRQHVHRGHTIGPGVAGDGVRQTEVERTREHTEPPEERMLAGRQRARRPLDGGAHRVTRAAGAMPEHVQPFVHHLQQVSRRQRPRAGRSQLDRQRQPIQPPAQLGNVLKHALVVVELGTGGACPLEEQFDGRGLLGIGAPRKRQRLDDHDLFAEDAQRFTARDEDDQLRHGCLQLAHHLADRRQHMLAVVEHDRSTTLGEHDCRRPDGLEAERSSHRLCVFVRSHGAEQGDGCRPAVTSLEAGSQLLHQPGLPDAAGTGQRDDRAGHGQSLQVGALALPTDQPPDHHCLSIALGGSGEPRRRWPRQTIRSPRTRAAGGTPRARWAAPGTAVRCRRPGAWTRRCTSPRRPRP